MRLARVMVAVDFSGPSLAAARWAARELAPGAEIVLAHVIRAPEAPSFLRPFLPATLDLLADIAP
ncbi:MAG: universal stress protein, partial [Gemmatimonadaceae bacterium]|nr:universal stress protein [Gemmatimonadaceae bacterium]